MDHLRNFAPAGECLRRPGSRDRPVARFRYFGDLVPFNPIWESIDSVFVKASQEQMDRELKEGIRVFRQALDEHHIHPYAICETPAFITEALNSKEAV